MISLPLSSIHKKTMPLPPGGATLHSLCFSHQIPSNSQQPNTTPLSAKPKTLQKQPPPPLLNTQIKDKIICLEIIGLDANKALSQNPSLHHTTPQSLQSTIDFLLSKGLHHKDLPRILDMCPTVLTSDIKSDLTPVFNFLSTDLNLPHHRLRRVINKCPRLLVSSVKAQLRPALAFLNGLGLKDLHALAHKYPVLLASSVDNTLIPKIDYLEGLVLSRDEAVGMVFRSPALLTYSIDNSFRPKFEYFKVDMEGRVEEVIEFPQYFSFSLEKRIKPRHMEVVKSGVVVPLPLMLKTTHEEFMQLLRQKV